MFSFATGLLSQLLSGDSRASPAFPRTLLRHRLAHPLRDHGGIIIEGGRYQLLQYEQPILRLNSPKDNIRLTCRSRMLIGAARRNDALTSIGGK
jgi:hypothetical protein